MLNIYNNKQMNSNCKNYIKKLISFTRSPEYLTMNSNCCCETKSDFGALSIVVIHSIVRIYISISSSIIGSSAFIYMVNRSEQISEIYCFMTWTLIEFIVLGLFFVYGKELLQVHNFVSTITRSFLIVLIFYKNFWFS